MKYKIIHFDETLGAMEKLSKEVNKQILLGWKPQGGIFITFNSHGNPTSYAQALILEDDSDVDFGSFPTI